MIVHFLGKTATIAQNADLYNRIKDVIRQGGHTIAYDFSDATYVEMGEGNLDKSDWALLCERDIDAVNRCEALIMDVSDKGVFGMGYMASMALLANKPVLLLIEQSARGGSFTCGLEHPQITRKIFNKGNIEVIISEFLEQCASEDVRG